MSLETENGDAAENKITYMATGHISILYLKVLITCLSFKQSLRRNNNSHAVNSHFVPFVCPKYNTEAEGGKSFVVPEIKLWHIIPTNIQDVFQVSSLQLVSLERRMSEIIL